MHVQRHTVQVTTDEGGDAVAYTERPVMGEIVNVIYEKASEGGFADGVDFLVETESTGQTVWDEDDVNASKSVSPMQAAHGTGGGALLYADNGEPVTRPIYAAQERLKFTVANGGDTKDGTFVVVVA